MAGDGVALRTHRTLTRPPQLTPASSEDSGPQQPRPLVTRPAAARTRRGGADQAPAQRAVASRGPVLAASASAGSVPPG